MNKSTKFYKKKKERIVYVMGGKCAICGYDKCQAALEVHHIDKKDKTIKFSNSNCYVK